MCTTARLLYYYCTTIVLLLYYYCTTTALPLYSNCTTTLLLLYYYCTTTVLLLTTTVQLLYYCTTTVLLLYYYCTTTVLLLYYYCTTTVLLLHYYCTTTVLLLYYYCTTTVLLYCCINTLILLYYCYPATVLLLYYHCKELISQPNPRAAAHPRSTPNPSAHQFPSNLIKATQILSQPTHQRRPRFHTIQAKSFGRGGGSIKRAATLPYLDPISTLRLRASLPKSSLLLSQEAWVSGVWTLNLNSATPHPKPYKPLGLGCGVEDVRLELVFRASGFRGLGV